MEKKKFRINGAMLLLVVLLLICIALISMVITKSNKNDEIVLPEYTSQIEDEILYKSGILYQVQQMDFVKSVVYTTELKADNAKYLRQYTVSETSCKTGDKVLQNDLIGTFGNEGESVEIKAEYSGLIISIEENANEKIVSVLNNESYYAEFYVNESDRNEFNTTTRLKVRYNSELYDCVITEIASTLTSQGLKIKIAVSDKDYSLINGAKISIERETKNVSNAICLDCDAVENKNYYSNNFGSESQLVKVCVATMKDDGSFELAYRAIRISDSNSKNYLVTSGLSAGEFVFVPNK